MSRRKTNAESWLSRRDLLKESAQFGASALATGLLVESGLSRSLQAMAIPAEPLKASISIDNCSIVRNRIDPHIYGTLIEHIGRVVYGGIYEEGSTLSDESKASVKMSSRQRAIGESPSCGGLEGILPRSIIGKMPSARYRVGRRNTTLPGWSRKAIISVPTSSWPSARKWEESPTFALTPARAPSRKLRTGLSIATAPKTLNTPTCAAKTGIRILTQFASGVSETKFTATGRSVIYKNAEDYTKFAVEAAKM